MVNLSDFAPWWSTNITVAVNIYLSDVPKMAVMPSGTIQANLYRKQLLFGNRGNPLPQVYGRKGHFSSSGCCNEKLVPKD